MWRKPASVFGRTQLSRSWILTVPWFERGDYLGLRRSRPLPDAAVADDRQQQRGRLHFQEIAMTRLRPTRRDWSRNVENVGERASRAIGWFVLALAVGGTTLAILVSW